MHICLMLRKCWSPEDEADGVDVKVNCFINSSCCAEGRMKDIEVIEAKDETDQNDIEITEVTERLKEETDSDDDSVIPESGKPVKDDILRSESSSRSNVHQCFGDCCTTSESTSKTMANETADVHITS